MHRTDHSGCLEGQISLLQRFTHCYGSLSAYTGDLDKTTKACFAFLQLLVVRVRKCEFERTVWASFSLKCRRFLECTRRMSSLRPPAPPLDLFWAECPRKGGCPRYAPCYASRLVFGRMSSKRWMPSLRLQQTGCGECLDSDRSTTPPPQIGGGGCKKNARCANPTPD